MKQSLLNRVSDLERQHGDSDAPQIIVFTPYGLNEADVTGMHSRATSIQRQPGESLDALHSRAEAATTGHMACWGYDL